MGGVVELTVNHTAQPSTSPVAQMCMFFLCSRSGSGALQVSLEAMDVSPEAMEVFSEAMEVSPKALEMSPEAGQSEGSSSSAALFLSRRKMNKNIYPFFSPFFGHLSSPPQGGKLSIKLTGPLRFPVLLSCQIIKKTREHEEEQLITVLRVLRQIMCHKGCFPLSSWAYLI